MGEKLNRRWTCEAVRTPTYGAACVRPEEHREDAGTYVIRAGDRIIGHVSSKGDAALICQSRRAAMEQLVHSSFEARQHRLKTQSMRKDIQLLMSTLTTVANSLKETTRRRDVTMAREQACRTLRKMKSRGYSP